jgi:hypothetical protein
MLTDQFTKVIVEYKERKKTDAFFKVIKAIKNESKTK